jgi:hypothetical protein
MSLRKLMAQHPFLLALRKEESFYQVRELTSCFQEGGRGFGQLMPSPFRCWMEANKLANKGIHGWQASVTCFPAAGTGSLKLGEVLRQKGARVIPVDQETSACFDTRSETGQVVSTVDTSLLDLSSEWWLRAIPLFEARELDRNSLTCGGNVTVEKRAGHPGHYFVKFIDSVTAYWRCKSPEDAVRVKQIGAGPDFESDVIMEVHVVGIKTVDGRSVSIWSERNPKPVATLSEVGGEVTLSNGARFENPLLPTGSRGDTSSFDLLYDATDWCRDWWGGYMEDDRWTTTLPVPKALRALQQSTDQETKLALQNIAFVHPDLERYPGLQAFELREGGVRCTFGTKNSRPQK